jgi:hypothetical protein
MHALKKGTRKGYLSKRRSFVRYQVQTKKALLLPWTEAELRDYVSWRFRVTRVCSSTLNGDLSALHELHDGHGVPYTCCTAAIRRVIKGYGRMQMRVVPHQLDISWPQLKLVLATVGDETPFQRCIQCGLLFQFFMVVRSGSYTTQVQRRSNCSRTIKIGHLTWTLKKAALRGRRSRLRSVYFRLKGEKQDSMNRGRGMYREILDDELYCPIKLLERMLLDRYPTMEYAIENEYAYLFETKPGCSLTSRVLNRELKNAVAKRGWDAKRYASHSIRRGAATTLKFHGLSIPEIQGLGGWKSDAIYAYLLENKHWQHRAAIAFTKPVAGVLLNQATGIQEDGPRTKRGRPKKRVHFRT